VPRGETAGAALVVDGLTVQAGDRDLLQEVDWRVMPGQRWGLVGSNGAGKSTMMRILCGTRGADAGSVMIAPKVEMGYLAQTAVSGSERTVWEEARSHMHALVAAERDMADAEARLEGGDTEAATALAAAQEAWLAAGGPDSDKRITNVLTGLGFRQEQFHVSASQFSGGWQMRIALARLLLGPAGQAAASGLSGGLLLLDEPTNHLDSSAIKWLGNFLRTSGGTVVVVSHDESLLEDVCDHIVEIRGKQLHTYAGGFRYFMEQRDLRAAQARATAAAQQQEIERLERFVERFGAKASKASQAQSKAKLAEKLRDEMVEVPTAASALGGGDLIKVALKLPRAPPCFTDVLMLKGASVGWGTPGVLPPLLTNVDLTIKKGQRVLVLGPNGAGKSTLLKALGGQLALWSGSRKEGEGVKMAVFSQDLAQDLPLHKTALQYVEDTARAYDPNITLEKCRAALGALGLVGSMALQEIGVLSGGEKARVALAAFALVPSNVLLLDEASNHLDAATINVLTGALQEFEGAIVAITHNPAFAASLNATHVLRVAGGKAVLSTNMGLTDKDFQHEPAKLHMPAPAPAPAAAPKAAAPAPAAAPKAAPKQVPAAAAAAPAATSSTDGGAAPAAAKPAKKRTTLSWQEQQEYTKLSKEMEALGKKRDALQERVSGLASSGGDFKALEAAAAELAGLVAKIEEVEVRWLELAEIAGDI